jgi:drug/metabolite transporter (DMT)-like permease
MDVRSAVAAVVTLVFWSSAFAGIRYGLEAFEPMELALLRFTVASIALLAYALFRRFRLPDARDIPAIAVIALLGITIYHTTLNLGEQTVSAGAASLLISTSPIFMVLMAAAFFKERLTRLAIAGMSLSFIGATLISFGKEGRLEFNTGALLIVIAAIAGAIYSLGQKRLLPKYGAPPMTAYCVWIGTIFLMPAAPGLVRSLQSAPWPAIVAVAYLGICPTAVAYVTWAYVLKRFPASRAASILYLVPVLAIVIAWIWIDEIPAWISLVGGVLAVAGVVLVNWRPKETSVPVEV